MLPTDGKELDWFWEGLKKWLASSPNLFFQRRKKLPASRPNFHEVIKWKHFPRYWPFVRGIHRSPVDSPDKGQWRGALMFSFICAWINGWANNCEAGDLRCHCTHYDIIVKLFCQGLFLETTTHFGNSFRLSDFKGFNPSADSESHDVENI